ncbi:MAG TPA: 3-hydroxybutyrate oligomer hydrolase family protein, partial [Lysobacter sp.]|nr:3-hydroxybutyrate oligomer hydrolase family protein [Lysobacter sp.]
MKTLVPRFVLLSLAALLAACAATGPRLSEDSTMFYALRISEHRDGDDLLTAGLGLAGLRSPVAPAFADPAHPTPAELRRRAIWSNWRGIADLTPGGGYGEWYGRVDTVVGAEFQSLATVPGATQPHRVLVQVPDGFSQSRRCLVVTASSGSRGIYGAIAVAGAWGLANGCAVAYTDKGAGTDYYDLDAGLG